VRLTYQDGRHAGRPIRCMDAASRKPATKITLPERLFRTPSYTLGRIFCNSFMVL
jgi:hypothetical protein